MIKFTHLHLHTEYSMLDGANQIKRLVDRLHELNMDSVAITDHGNLFGALDFYTTMLSEGIKPIIGIETYVHEGLILGEINDSRYHLCLFAKNEEGYKNLMYLSSLAYLEGFRRNPRINRTLLKEHSKGVICSSACLQGEVNYHLNASNKGRKIEPRGYEHAKKIALEYQEIFGEDFYLEIMRHGISDQQNIDKEIIRLSLETGIKLIATNDAHYPNKEDATSHEVTTCISTGKVIADSKRMRHLVDEFYVKSQEEMLALFRDIPEALENTQEIVNKCELMIDLKGTEIRDREGNIVVSNVPPTPPSFKFTKEYALNEHLDVNNDADYFEHKCLEGLNNRLKSIDIKLHEQYHNRLMYEVEVIKRMKFAGYMLIVWDFVREARAQKIPVGPGRGSAAGSLVAFCLGITDVDPIKHDLLFERFLNPERISMPDIDMDFCQERRGDIIDYVIKKYGEKNVSQVATFNSLSARSVIRDVARVYAVEYKKADEFVKLIPDRVNKLEEALKEDRIRQKIHEDSELKNVWDIATRLEGQKRNIGTHAAALVIDSEHELWEKIPLCRIKDKVTTQYSMDYLEKVNLIKFDFLGLKTLTAIQRTFDLIGKQIDFNLVDLDDPRVYETIKDGNTVGIFQIESSGMQALNKKVGTNSFNDLVAVLALFRPGPMGLGMHDTFAKRKRGEKISYIFKELEPILSSSYGVIVYQEQVMEIVQAIAGFSLGEADLIRRAMGKKDEQTMAQNKAKFINGAKAKGFDPVKSADLWEMIVQFAGYGFNKSHSVAYSLITFQTAYLKTYYPNEFMAALLTNEKNNLENINLYVQEARERMNIEVLAPHVNISESDFSVKEIDGKKKIVFGFSAIKGIGSNPIKNILEVRNEGGKFKNIDDFLSRVDSKVINKKTIESLVLSGSLKDLGYSVRTLHANIDTVNEALRECNKRKLEHQSRDNIFSTTKSLISVNIGLENVREYSYEELLDFEYQILGIYMSGNPLQGYEKEIRKVKGLVLSSQVNQLDNCRVYLVGKVKESKISKTSKGNRKREMLLVDLAGGIRLVAFGRADDSIERLDLSHPIALKCKVEVGDEGAKIWIEEVMTLLEAYKEKLTPKFRDKMTEVPQEEEILIIDVPVGISVNKLQELYDIAIESSGPLSLVLKLSGTDSEYLVYTPLKVSRDLVSKAGWLKIA